MLNNKHIPLTYADYCRLDDGQRYELMGGELFLVPSPSVVHQYVSFRLSRRMADYVEENQLGVVLTAPLDVCLSPHDVVQPDIIFISRGKVDIIAEANIQGAPDLVVEVLSPSTASRDRQEKKLLYAKSGVKELWLIHPVARTLEIYHLDAGETDEPARYTGTAVEVTTLLIPGWELKLSDIF